MSENLQKRKEELVEQIGEDEIKKLKKVKLLKLIQNEIQELLNYWNVKQVHQLVQVVFNVNISAPLFYRFFQQNLKKDEKLESVVKTGKKSDVGVSQKRDIKKESILSEDELSAIAMFGSFKNQVKD